MKVLVTGGAGYIGSHTCVELAGRGHQPLIYDNFANSSPRVLEHLARILGEAPQHVRGDVRDVPALRAALAGCDAVIHFAALKAVGESCEKPVAYFDNNIAGTIGLLGAMREAGVARLVFSSSATVYGDPDACPIGEDAPLRVTNPYGRTKLVMEQLIGDVCAAHPEFHAAILRYFNPVGAHESGLIGEDPQGIPNNLVPYIAQVAAGGREKLRVFGNDYPTRDGTGVRDYIHVVDLARAHVATLDYLQGSDDSFTVNLGTGNGTSVLEMVHAFERASSREVPLEFAPRRPGDVAECYADPSRAQALLGWRAEHDLDRMCVDAWRWQSAYPRGYET